VKPQVSGFCTARSIATPARAFANLRSRSIRGPSAGTQRLFILAADWLHRAPHSQNRDAWQGDSFEGSDSRTDLSSAMPLAGNLLDRWFGYA
jgi:hypothetical protein